MDRLFTGSETSGSSSAIISPVRDISTGSGKELLSTNTPYPMNSTAISMYLPGRILHIEESHHSGDIYTLAEVHRTVFSEILVSPRMLSDHLPNHLDMVFQACSDTQHILPISV